MERGGEEGERPALNEKQSQRAAEIVRLHVAIASGMRNALHGGVEIGRMLRGTKARMPHGSWTAWMKEHLPFTQRTAEKYMRLSRLMGEQEDKANPTIVGPKRLAEEARDSPRHGERNAAAVDRIVADFQQLASAPMSMRVYLELIGLCQGSQKNWSRISYGVIADLAGLTETQARRALNWLRDRNLVSVEVVAGSANTYSLAQFPETGLAPANYRELLERLDVLMRDSSSVRKPTTTRISDETIHRINRHHHERELLHQKMLEHLVAVGDDLTEVRRVVGDKIMANWAAAHLAFDHWLVPEYTKAAADIREYSSRFDSLDEAISDIARTPVIIWTTDPPDHQETERSDTIEPREGSGPGVRQTLFDKDGEVIDSFKHQGGHWFAETKKESRTAREIISTIVESLNRAGLGFEFARLLAANSKDHGDDHDGS